MATNSPPPAPEEKVNELLAAVREVQAERSSHRRPPPDTPLWRLVDNIGRVAIPIGLVATVLGFGLSSIGPEWVWASLLFLVTLILFIIYIPALIRHNTRQQIADEQIRYEQLENARNEVARMIMQERKQHDGRK